MSDSFSLFGEPEEPAKPKRKAKRDTPATTPGLFGDIITPEPSIESDNVVEQPLDPLPTRLVTEVVKPDILPDFLGKIWGQDRPKNILFKLIQQDHLPHALMLYGPEGIGKQQVAIELARHLNCQFGPFTACGVCPDCQQFATLQHTQLFLAFPTKANDGDTDRKEQSEAGETKITRRYGQKTEDDIANAIAETVRDRWLPLAVPGATNVRVITIRFLRQWAQFGTWLGKGRKVAIISQSHMMNEETSNALLKILEEPPPDTLLILLARSPEDVLPTILSRCQSIRMEPLSPALLSAKLSTLPPSELSRETPLPRDDIPEIALLADGSFVRARELATEDVDVRMEAAIEFLVGCVFPKSRRSLLEQIDNLTGRGKKKEKTEDEDKKKSKTASKPANVRNIEETEKFLLRIVLFLRDAIRLREHHGDGLPEGLSIREDGLLNRLRKFVQFTVNTDLPAVLQVVVEAQDALRHRNPQLQLFLHGLSYRLYRAMKTV